MFSRYAHFRDLILSFLRASHAKGCRDENIAVFGARSVPKTRILLHSDVNIKVHAQAQTRMKHKQKTEFFACRYRVLSNYSSWIMTHG